MGIKNYVKPEVFLSEIYMEDGFVVASKYVHVGGDDASFSFEVQVTETKKDDSWVFDSLQL